MTYRIFFRRKALASFALAGFFMLFISCPAVQDNSGGTNGPQLPPPVTFSGTITGTLPTDYSIEDLIVYDADGLEITSIKELQSASASYADFDTSANTWSINKEIAAAGDSVSFRVVLSHPTDLWKAGVAAAVSAALQGANDGIAVSMDGAFKALKTAADINAIRAGLSDGYVLLNDIDLTSVGAWEAIGNNVNTNAPFTGQLYGEGHTISGLTLANFSTTSGQITLPPIGFLGKLEGADAVVDKVNFDISNDLNTAISLQSTIANPVGVVCGVASGGAKITNIRVTSSVPDGGLLISQGDANGMGIERFRLGAIAGYAKGAATVIQGCSSNLAITGTTIDGIDGRSDDDYMILGGLAGVLEDGAAIKMSYCEANLQINDDINKDYIDILGGIAGKVDGGIIEDSYANCVINVNDKCIRLGGIAGDVKNSAIISRSYSKGSITATRTAGTQNAAGIAGYVTDCTIQDCAAFTELVTSAANTKTYRIAYTPSGTNTLSGNIALSTMTLTGTRTPADAAVDKQDGADTDTGDSIYSSWLSVLDDAVWDKSVIPYIKLK